MEFGTRRVHFAQYLPVSPPGQLGGVVHVVPLH